MSFSSDRGVIVLSSCVTKSRSCRGDSLFGNCLQNPNQIRNLNKMPAESLLQMLQLEGTSPDESNDDGGLLTTYFEIAVRFPKCEPIRRIEELTDDDLISAAVGGGTFKFLDAPEEDIYSV